MSIRSDQMVLVTNVYPVGGHLAGWRDPNAYERIAMNLDAMLDIARLAERGKFHSLFLADGNAVRQMDRPAYFEAVSPTDRPANFEPTTLMAAISQHTDRIGLFVTATTTFEPPYLLARRLSSLDHLSKGRAIWNVVTTSYPGDSVNFGDEPFPERTPRYARAAEFVEVVKGLWDSWADDAFPQNKETGQFLDSTRVHVLGHRGEYFSVRGPLNLSRSPQGYPVLFMAGQSEPGRELAAKHAECLFASAHTMEQCRAVGDDIRARMVKYGRSPDEIKIIPGIRVNVAGSKAEALEGYRRLAEFVSPALGLEYLSAYVHADLSGYDVDEPMPDLSALPFEGVTSIRDQLCAEAGRHGWTIRETYTSLIVGKGEDEPFTGTADEIADQMQEWFDSGACDGFMVSTPTLPIGLERFVDLVVPELQRRGVYHEDYVGGTLRDELGLREPVNPYFGAVSERAAVAF